MANQTMASVETLFVVCSSGRFENNEPTVKKMKAIHGEENVLAYAKTFTNSDRRIERIYTVDFEGQFITYYQVVFEGFFRLKQLSIVEIPGV